MSVAAPHTDGKATYADIEALPDHISGEILAGELHVSPRPANPHANAATALNGELWNPFRRGKGGPGGWLILAEPELNLGIDPDYSVVVPDLAGWRDKTPQDFGMATQFAEVPTWVCEIISPSTGRRDRTLKLPFYHRAGVQYLWLVDPLQKTLEVFDLRGDIPGLIGSFAGEVKVNAAPFEVFDLELGVLWIPEPAEGADDNETSDAE